jgi:tetratricopeptide (TPR) repeat protein
MKHNIQLSVLLLAASLFVFFFSSSLSAADNSSGITKQVDQILIERDNGNGPTVISISKKEVSTQLAESAGKIRESVKDQSWIVLALDSLRKTGSTDSVAWFDLYEKALISMQGALNLNDGMYPSEMTASGLGRVREDIRRTIAEKLLESLDNYEAALAANPWDDNILAGIGGVLDDLGRIYSSLEFRQKAIEVAYKRLALDPSNYFAGWDLADQLRSSGKNDAAIEAYDQAVFTLRAYAWEDEGGDSQKPVGRRRDHLALLLREKLNLSMKLGREDDFKIAIEEWRAIANEKEKKDIADLQKWLDKSGGSLKQAKKVDRIWKLIDQGREIEAREYLLTAIEDGKSSSQIVDLKLTLADLEFYRLEMHDIAIGRLSTLLNSDWQGLADSLKTKTEDARSLMILNHGVDLEMQNPESAWSLYTEAANSDGKYYTPVALRIGAMLINRPQEALSWLKKAERASHTSTTCAVEDKIEIQELLVETYRRLNQPENARKAWNKARELRK